MEGKEMKVEEDVRKGRFERLIGFWPTTPIYRLVSMRIFYVLAKSVYKRGEIVLLQTG